MKIVARLTEAICDDRNVVGGKAQGLYQLIRLGVPVPDGICVTVEAFRRFAAQPDVRDAIDVAEDRLAAESSVRERQVVGRELRERLQGAEVPPSIALEIENAYTQLVDPIEPTGPLVAVRSSAVGEDSAQASFAGLYRSYLNVSGAAEVVEKVRACWLSLWTTEATEYRFGHPVMDGPPLMAVLIQCMVRSRVSGVLFTANPVTGRLSEMVINADVGLGEALVSGRTAPMELRVRSRFCLRYQCRVAVKQQHASGKRRLVLTTHELTQLVRVARHIEAHFGGPQDIEWAFDDGRLYVVQTRPITGWNVGDEPLPAGAWTRRGLDEWLQRPLSPLFSTLALPPCNEEVACLVKRRWGLQVRKPAWVMWGGYLYVRVDPVLSISLVKAPVRFLRGLRTVAREWRESFQPEYLRRLEAVQGHHTASSPVALLDRISAQLNLMAEGWGWVVVSGINAKVAIILARVILRSIGVGRRETEQLFTGFESSSAKADQALWELAQEARANGELAASIRDRSLAELHRVRRSFQALDVWLDAFESWIDTYGHRVFDLDIAQPTLSDEPETVLEMLRSSLQEQTISPKIRLDYAVHRREDAQRSLEKRLRRYPSLARTLVRRLVRLAVDYAEIREDRPFYLHMNWPPLRHALIGIGQMLADARVLEEAEDVFYLEANELREAAEWLVARTSPSPVALIPSVRTRRMKRDMQSTRVPPLDLHPNLLIRIVRYIGDLSRKRRLIPPTVLLGTAASGGHVRARARILQTSDELGTFQHGEILVASLTTPAWTPLFSRAAGVVTEVGGSLSHAAIVAREYGIPAVVGIPDVLRRVRDGMELEVNGDAGTVNLLGEAEEDHNDRSRMRLIDPI